MDRVQAYMNSVVDDLTSASNRAGATTANRGDIGTNRELALLSFLDRHLPRRFSSALGGMVVGSDGSESKQIDIIVSHDLGLRFEQNGRTFAVAESVASAFSVKSHLTRPQLRESLLNLASIPEPTAETLGFPSAGPAATIHQFLRHHPTNFVFAFESVSPDILREEFEELLHEFPEDRRIRRTTVVVNGRYTISYHRDSGRTSLGEPIAAESLHISRAGAAERAYPLAVILNKINSYLSWLGWMDVNVHPYLTRTYFPG